MTQYFPIVVERETNGTYSAWVAGIPGVYAAADSAGRAKRAILGALKAHVQALRDLGREPQPSADISVVRREVYATRGDEFSLVGIGALLGQRKSRARAAASRRNGRKGGRPRGATKLP